MTERNLVDKIRLIDLFAYTDFLRYKKEDAYQTKTGGVCSILILIMVLIFIIPLAITTFSKTNYLKS